MATRCGLSTDAKRKKVIFCCDPGGDDAVALILLLRNPEKIEILAIAINAGNTNVQQEMINTLRILKLMNRLDIPVYKGHDNILNNDKLLSSDNFFGNDAFGDFIDGTVFDYTPYTQKSSVGNITPVAEFNFYYDPEAANEVMTKWKGDICLVTWELCLSAAQSWDWYDLNLVRKPNKTSTFLKNVLNKVRIKTKKYVPCDELAAALLIDSKIIAQCKPIRRGESVVDWRSENPDKNVYLVTEIDVELLKEYLLTSTYD
ncbi:hypothetical protein HELRODRAFT_165585 [Helobdella robusta]|uniref:Inosine/uridine-preferring nucleoside hydrolase domain-containing protein n=1 Tax=Helobdella robusta TaxID=6412 RepID=T1EX13_HELRO|nr:hypothetical protein HELRODRAFT_165585 [Helobdella robusta]ESN91532.1 hypothetical protein HELRODRAFT_165585 [Helobdella robusta]